MFSVSENKKGGDKNHLWIMLFKTSANSGIYRESKPINSQTIENEIIKFIALKLALV